jgi:hypothetical protein
MMLYCNKLSFVFIFKILLAVNFPRINDKRGKHNTKLVNYYTQQKITNRCDKTDWNLLLRLNYSAFFNLNFTIDQKYRYEGILICITLLWQLL